MRKTACLALFGALLLLADDPRQPVQVSKTEHMDFPSGGLLRLVNVIGDLSIESWDEPGIQLTTNKTTKLEYAPADKQEGMAELDKVRVDAARQANELTLTITYPRYRHLSLPLRGSTRFSLETRLLVPRNTRLDIDGAGQISIANLTGAIDAHVWHGTIVVRLPENGHYDIDARAKWGNINNDFAGEEKRARWLIGHRVVNQAEDAAAQKLHLRAGYGDIVILKTHQPQAPLALKPAS